MAFLLPEFNLSNLFQGISSQCKEYPITSILGGLLVAYGIKKWWNRRVLLDSWFPIDEAKFYELQYVGKHSSEIGLDDIPNAIKEMKKVFQSNITRRVSNRKKQLRKMEQMLIENEHAIMEAIKADLGRCELMVAAYEIYPVLSEIRKFIKNIESWSAPQPMDGISILTFPSWDAHVMEPYGTVYVNGIWNFPFQLALSPIAGAIAAGNNVIFKPCNTSRESALLLCDLLHKYMDSRFVQVLGHPTLAEGNDNVVTDKILDSRFDMIFFTGSTNGGRYIMKKAAVHLTPVVLELGGKNPVIIDDTADLGLAARQIINARMINGGQQCISPDYVLCYARCVEAFTAECVKYIGKWYKTGDELTQDLGQSQSKLVNESQLERVCKMVQSTNGKVIYGGKWDAKTRMFEPTLVRLSNIRDLDNEETMKSETFGPVLWIIPINNNIKEALNFINEKMEKSLTLYLFSKSKHHQNLVIHNTSSGAVQVNGTLTYAAHGSARFGGVGNSGMGSYHGKHSFDTFTHKKPVVVSYLEPPFNAVYPPYDPEWKRNLLKWII